eukprot:jgi/Phyca11/125815/e_gw1.60.138.1
MTRSLGLLRQDVQIEVTDCSKSNYGVAYQRRENIGIETHGSQKAIQERCKELAQLSGFQLFVKSFSSKANDNGNAKYVCKKLNGQQFFDKNTSYDEIKCPFAINVNGVDGSWKVTRINFAHNHVMRVGFTEQPPAEGTLARSHLAKRNTTQDLVTLTHLIGPNFFFERLRSSGAMARIKWKWESCFVRACNSTSCIQWLRIIVYYYYVTTQA